MIPNDRFIEEKKEEEVTKRVNFSSFDSEEEALRAEKGFQRRKERAAYRKVSTHVRFFSFCHCVFGLHLTPLYVQLLKQTISREQREAELKAVIDFLLDVNSNRRILEIIDDSHLENFLEPYNNAISSLERVLARINCSGTECNASSLSITQKSQAFKKLTEWRENWNGPSRTALTDSQKFEARMLYVTLTEKKMIQEITVTASRSSDSSSNESLPASNSSDSGIVGDTDE